MTTRTGCNIDDDNPLNQTVGDCSTASTSTTSPCSDGSLVTCPPSESCDLWQLTDSPETCYIANLIDEQLRIAGANINVFKLLGVHEQGSLEDMTGLGAPISGGDLPNFPASNAFDKLITEWRSRQTGAEVLTSAFIGYDFGPIRLDNGRLRYGVETFLKKEVASIRIKQGCEPENRVTKARLERSPDGEKWFGVAVVDLPDCDGLVTVSVKRSVPSRYWRLRPIVFNGGTNDYWVVQAFQLTDYEATHISNIQDKIFLENRDRDYADSSIAMKASYTPTDVLADSTKMGFMSQNVYIFETSFLQTLAKLGRPFVIGDIIELPSEKQYTPSLKPVLKYLEIEDVAWSVNGYTPGWVPTMQRLIAKPVLATQETQKVMGKLTQDVDSSGLVDIDDGMSKKYQDYAAVTETIEAEANTMSPLDGIDYANIPKLSSELKEILEARGKNTKNLDRNRNQYGIDAMPPNGLPYTEGDSFPTSPKNNDYHRLTYSTTKNIAPRLYRWSKAKEKWIYLETDRRFQIRNDKSLIEEFKAHSDATSIADVDKKLQDDL